MTYRAHDADYDDDDDEDEDEEHWKTVLSAEEYISSSLTTYKIPLL